MDYALKQKRMAYGISQNRLAVCAGISREYLNKIENGKLAPSPEILKKLQQALEKLNPDSPLELMIDYVRIRFPTMNVQYVVEQILKLKMDYMIHEDFGFYSYTEHFVLGDIFVLISADTEKGVLVEMKGKGCRQMENYLLAQHRSWYDFFSDILKEKGIMKRLDIAINDKAGILDIPMLTTKCENEECISIFRSFKSYRSGELLKSREDDKYGMGSTLYIGSLKSDVYFCTYEKAYEQYAKYHIPVEDTDIRNRFEIRLKNERACKALEDLVAYQDAERTAFSIINRYIRFVDSVEGKRRSDWPLSPDWEYFIGTNRGRLKLTTRPEPYTFQRTLNWLSHQVGPTLKVTKELDALKGTEILDTIIKEAKLTKKHKKLIKQQTASISELIYEGDETLC